MFFDGVCVVQKLTKKNHQPYVHLKCDCYCLYSSVIIVVMDTQTHTGFKWLNMLVWETNVVLTRKKNIYVMYNLLRLRRRILYFEDSYTGVQPRFSRMDFLWSLASKLIFLGIITPRSWLSIEKNSYTHKHTIPT